MDTLEIAARPNILLRPKCSLVRSGRERSRHFVVRLQTLHRGDGVFAGCVRQAIAALEMRHAASFLFQRQCQMIPGLEADLHILWRGTVEFDAIIAAGEKQSFL